MRSDVRLSGRAPGKPQHGGLISARQRHTGNTPVPRLARALYVAAIAVAALASFFVLRGGVETDLFSLVGGDATLTGLNARSARDVRVLCADAARAARCRAVFRFDAAADPAKLLETVRTHGRGLLCAKSRELLEKGDVERVRRGTRRRDFSGMGLFPKADDPNYFLSDFVASLKALRPDSFPDGAEILVGETDGGEECAAGLRRLVGLARSDDGIMLSGAPFHSILATERTKREINVLGAVSLAAVFILGWILFGSFRFAPAVALALACGFASGSAAVCLLPGRPHALTFLFGTTLVGLGVDYCYHALAVRRRELGFVRLLSGALVTTCLAFSPLMLSRVAVLRQVSVFIVAGLVAVFGFAVMFASGTLSAKTVRLRPLPFAGFRRAAAVALAVAASGVALWRGARFSSDPSLFHTPDPVMARGEAKFAELSGGGGGGRLALVPLRRWQEKNAALKAKVEEPRGEFLSAADLPRWLVAETDGEEFLVLPEKAAEKVVGHVSDGGVRVLDVRGDLRSMFETLSRETYVLLAVAVAVLAAAMLAVFRRRFVRYVCPVVAAAAATFATLVALGEQITFFHALCFFIVIGLGIDYAIFHGGTAEHAEKGQTSVVVLFSFLTSFIGFGMLSFTSFKVTRSMGVTLAIGLFFAYFFSFFAVRKGSLPEKTHEHPRKKGGEPGGSDGKTDLRHSDGGWSEQSEQSAGRFRILVIWWIYRFFGKTAAKIAFLPAFLFIYPFCRAARSALRQYYGIIGIKGSPFRHLLGFSWSLIDKTDACSLCKDPPKFRIEGDVGWMGGGCFLLSTHLGCIEVLPALCKGRGENLRFPDRVPVVHAFQQMGHDAVFAQIFTKNLNSSNLDLCAVEDIGVESAVEMKEAVGRGDIVLMAGDRLPASRGESPHGMRGGTLAGARSRELERVFFGRVCRWPKGVFRFAKLMEAPVYAIVCVRTGWNEYDVRAKRLQPDALPDGYISFLESETRRNPLQWYQFYLFFGQKV